MSATLSATDLGYPHKNEEGCYHRQGIQRKATAQPACLANFKDDLWGWAQPVCYFCFGLAVRTGTEPSQPQLPPLPKSGKKELQPVQGRSSGHLSSL